MFDRTDAQIKLISASCVTTLSTPVMKQSLLLAPCCQRQSKLVKYRNHQHPITLRN